MGAGETTPPSHARRGNQPGDRLTRQTPGRLSLAPDHRPPLAGIKLVRPRPRLPAWRCGRSTLTPGRATAQTGSDEEKPELQSPPKARRRKQRHRVNPPRLLTAGALGVRERPVAYGLTRFPGHVMGGGLL
jgi:hypothetical protein